MENQDVISLMQYIVEKRGGASVDLSPEVSLRDAGFRSLDFSELCLRVEEKVGKELNFEATSLRSIQTVGDVCAFISTAVK